jgi:hypothetical protein
MYCQAASCVSRALAAYHAILKGFQGSRQELLTVRSTYKYRLILLFNSWTSAGSM